MVVLGAASSFVIVVFLSLFDTSSSFLCPNNNGFVRRQTFLPTRGSSSTQGPMIVRSSQQSHSRSTTLRRRKSTTSLQISLLETISSFPLIATIDSDIESIPTDKFGEIFAGGAVVMFGGVFSALVVGLILEWNDSYADVIADSYAQGTEEEFWESLSPEQKEEAEKVLSAVRSSKTKEDTGVDKTKALESSTSVEEGAGEVDPGLSLFSDYDD